MQISFTLSGKLIVAQWHHISSLILVKIGLDHGLLSDRTKPFSDTIYTYSQLDSSEKKSAEKF